MDCVLLIILNMLNATMLVVHGFGATTWQYWFSMACVCGAYLVGALKE